MIQLLLLLACRDDAAPDAPVPCSEVALASVSGRVTDPDGALLGGVTATWWLGEGSPMPAECTNEECSEFVAGWEVVGTITVLATYSEADPEEPGCWFSDSDQETVEISLDAEGCHVVGEQVTLVLDIGQRVCD